MAAKIGSPEEIAGLGPKTDRPRLNTAIDLAKHKLSPTEGFVLSRVDGRSSYDEICLMSSLGREETLRILRGFRQARLILAPGEVATESPRPLATAGGKDRGTPMAPLERLDDGSPVADAEIADWPDGSVELKTRIVRLHRRLRNLSARDLLGVDPGADKASLKRAFAAASKELHPDRYFSQNLGSFKAKLATIFARLSEAMREIAEEHKAGNDPR